MWSRSRSAPARFRPARTLALGLSLVGAMGQPAAAQEAKQKERMTVEFAEAILRTFGSAMSDGDTLRPETGKVSGKIAARLEVPRGLHVIGSVAHPQGAMVFASTPLAPDSVRALFTTELRGRGWTASTAEFPGTRGFQSGPALTERGLVFCRGADEEIEITIMPRQGAPHDVMIGYQTSGTGMCQFGAAGGRAAMYRSPFEDLPPLYPPAPGSTRETPGRCARRSHRSSSQSEMVATALPADSVLQHYGEQLERAGWHAVGSSARASTGAWTKTDSSGAVVRATLVVGERAEAPGCRELSLTVER